ncbi:hypothetical protein JBF11_03625 [Taurinivorans muris]|uniref:Uncharacterized protein n=1 Tax=Taurinivorans muris TaxID=2787751 RepID=A0ABY5Y4C7_9BACT|nr:hypothetical protein JBF11_03625 [Desulfovibrionaceae bacterium LT0009]
MFNTQLEKDISSIFLNLREFAEQIDLDGQEVPAVVEDLELSPDNSREGVSFEGRTLYLHAVCLQYEYVPHKSCLLNGEVWYVLESSVELGLAIVKLYREKA